MSNEDILAELVAVRRLFDTAYDQPTYEETLAVEREAVDRFDSLIRRLKEAVWWNAVKPAAVS